MTQGTSAVYRSVCACSVCIRKNAQNVENSMSHALRQESYAMLDSAASLDWTNMVGNTADEDVHVQEEACYAVTH